MACVVGDCYIHSAGNFGKKLKQHGEKICQEIVTKVEGEKEESYEKGKTVGRALATNGDRKGKERKTKCRNGKRRGDLLSSHGMLNFMTRERAFENAWRLDAGKNLLIFHTACASMEHS